MSILLNETINEYKYKVSLKDYIIRILILGSKMPLYNSTQKNLDQDAIIYIKEQIEIGNGIEILNIMSDIYKSGRAPKQDAIFMIHALLCRSDNIDLRLKALEFIKEYRTISQLYSWKTFHKNNSATKGFGRAVKRNINRWILSKTPSELAYQFTKYVTRGEWGLVDFLKCCHTKTGTGDERTKDTHSATPIDLVLRYAVNGIDKMKDLAEKFNLTEDPVYKYLITIDWAKKCDINIESNKLLLIDNIYKYNLTREHMPTLGLKYSEIQTALLVNIDKTKITMPMTALLRNLANLSRIGVFEDIKILNLVVEHLQNKNIITLSKIHPVNVLTTWFTYRKGFGKMSKHIWNPISKIVNALEQMFYLSFKNIEPIGKRICFLIDCSGSMGSESLCEGVTNAEAAALLAMTFARAIHVSRVQQSFYLFTSGKNGLMDVSDLIHANATFNDVLSAVQRSDWAATDISKGILEAMKFKRYYDGFVVITDNDVNSGIKPSIALNQYRNEMKLPAKLAVVATFMTDLSIADPSDNGMMDFCGFDSFCPKLLQEFFN
jgi:60 kDa SS-A/Ro ribonucleoprotein